MRVAADTQQSAGSNPHLSWYLLFHLGCLRLRIVSTKSPAGSARAAAHVPVDPNAPIAMEKAVRRPIAIANYRARKTAVSTRLRQEPADAMACSPLIQKVVRGQGCHWLT
jgi:hypothetical protein